MTGTKLSFIRLDFATASATIVFHFNREQISDLWKKLRIPDVVHITVRDAVPGAEAMCILLQRFSYPARWIDLRQMFGRSEAALSRILLTVADHVECNFCWAFESRDQSRLTEEDFALFCCMIAAKGGVLEGCFGFVDRNARHIARSKRLQRECFSGHKRQHCMKWQKIVTPNGIMCKLCAGHRESMHDSFLLRRSQVMEQIVAKIAGFERNEKYLIYGDSGYGRRRLIKSHLLPRKPC